MEIVGIIVLIISGIYFSFKLKFKHFNMIKAVKTMLKSNNLGISSFQSLCISLASKIGVGSLAGVVLSIYVGGVGSIFWMWIITLICSSNTMVESILSIKHRKKKDNNYFEGGSAGNLSAGTLLQNIMRTTNSDGINAGNAQTLIYGRAYVRTESGYIFGQSVAQSFCDLVCGVDAVWNSLNIQQQQGVLELVRDYENVMSTWEIPNILESYRR